MLLRSFFFALVLVTGGCVSTNYLRKPFDALGSPDNELRNRARTQLQASFAKATAPGEDPNAALELETKVIAQIASELPLSERLYLIHLLELFGGEASIEALKGYLPSEDPELRDSARRALAGIPDPKAGEVLVEAFRQSDPLQGRAYLDALVYRGDDRARAVIEESLLSDDASLVEVSALALGKFGATESLAALQTARARVEAPSLPSIEGAILNIGVHADLAYVLAESGSNASIRYGAFQHLLQQDADRALTILDAALQDPAFPGRSRIITEAILHGPKETKQDLVQALSSMSLDDQLTVIEAVGDVGGPEFEAALLALVPKAGPALKSTLVDVLSQIGGDASYESLYQAFAQSPKDRLIAQAVASLRSDSADPIALEKARQAVDVDERVTAIRVLALRNSPGATELLNAIISQPGDKPVREEAMKALETIGNLESVRQLATLIVVGDPSIRRAQLSLKRLSIHFNAAEELWEDAYQPVLENAPNDAARDGLVLLLDGIACESSLAYIRPFIRDRSSPLHVNALRALTRWPLSNAGDVWLEDVVRNDPSDKEMARAQQALVRLLSNEKVEGDALDKLELAVRSVEMAPSADFKRAIIGSYQRVLSWPEAHSIKKVFAPLLDDPDVSDLVKQVSGR